MLQIREEEKKCEEKINLRKRPLNRMSDILFALKGDSNFNFQKSPENRQNYG